MNALIVVAKQPLPGNTKTRLSPPLSVAQASQLYECFLGDTLDLVRQVPGAHPMLAYFPTGSEGYFSGLAPDFNLILQEGEDLGERLDNALRACFNLGYRRVAIMDSDSPTLPLSCLLEAFRLLADGSDVVLGPCDDGGYYLIGMKRPESRLLREVKMSTPHVAADTLALASKERRKVGLLPVWYDVDDSASLARLAAEIEYAQPQIAPRTRAYLQRAAIRELVGAIPRDVSV